MTKILNFALKIKGVVGRVAHAKSSDPATPPKFGMCTLLTKGCPIYSNKKNVNLGVFKLRSSDIPFNASGSLVSA